jgi:uncharacterized protein
VSIVVSDTSPIRALTHLGLLELLHVLFAEVFVPPAVIEELSRPGIKFKPISLCKIPFIRVKSVGNSSLVSQLLETLDLGESEALALAMEIHADAVLIDESAGRETAKRMGLLPLGVLGVLVRAKTRGLIGPLAPLLDQLQNELGFFISSDVRTEILRLSGE